MASERMRDDDRRALLRRALDDIALVPGVQSARGISLRPLPGPIGLDSPYDLEGQPPAAAAENPYVNTETDTALQSPVCDVSSYWRSSSLDFSSSQRPTCRRANFCLSQHPTHPLSSTVALSKRFKKYLVTLQLRPRRAALGAARIIDTSLSSARGTNERAQRFQARKRIELVG